MIRRLAKSSVSKSVKDLRFFQSESHFQPFGNRHGPPGRSANSGITATVFGAYGFVGRYFLSELGSVGSRVYVPYRGCELEVRHLKPMFDLGQLGLMAFSPRDEASILESIKHSDIVINMIGKYYETKHIVPSRNAEGRLSRTNYSYEDVNVSIPRTLARLSAQAGVKSFIHVSALAADPDSASEWSRTKAAGEDAVREEFPNAIVVRPAIVFGPEDRFLNWIAESMERLPISPLVNGGQTLIQPVYAADVGKGLMELVYNWEEFQGDTFQFAGPAEYSYKEVYEYVSDVTLHRKPLVDVPVPVAKLAGRVVNNLIQPFFTEDSIIQLTENVVANSDASTGLRNLSDLGIEPLSMDKVAFDYLHRFRAGGHFVTVRGYH